MTGTDDNEGPVELGRGRSGRVYRCVDANGRRIARKVFSGDTAAGAVHYLLSGAPGAYGWNEDAIRCALLRRRILVNLVEYWFPETLEVADAYDVSWSDDECCHTMDTRLIDGRNASLHHPFSAAREGEYLHLTREVMRPLQARLAESGFDGLVWQAGRGNPVAANNFLCVAQIDRGCRWAWIDLESGVPALFPINPLDLVGFYLPRSWHHGRPLYDDVEIPALERYTLDHSAGLAASIGQQRLAAMRDDIRFLEQHQTAWRALSRLDRGVTYRLTRGAITPDQARFYRRHPLRWYTRETLQLFRKAAAGLAARARALSRAIRAIDVRAAARAGMRFFSSQAYRSELAHRYVDARILRWNRRRQLSDTESRQLSDALRREAVGSYITDFGVHVAIKPAIKLFQWGVLPLLLAGGLIGPYQAAALLAFGGMIGRTLYTAGRMVQQALRGERLPWIAAGVGLLPIVGNAAYPVQILYHGAEWEGKLAGFIIYDTVSVAGELFPIWGGRDTATEHRVNRLGDLIVRDRAAGGGDAS